MNVLLSIREFIINNFFISIKTLEINNIIIKNNIFFHLFKIVPFCFLKIGFNYLNIKYIYFMDNLYFSNYTNEVKISPILMAIYGINSNIKDEENEQLLKNKENLLDKIKKYNFSVPLWFFIENENIINFDSLELKFFSKGKLTNKILSIKEYRNKMISDIFV